MAARLIPIYTTRGDVGAILAYPYLYSPTGEWIGWVTPERAVFSVLGRWVGRLSDEPRILRKRAWDDLLPPRQPPPAPPPIRPPATWPLAPLLPELTYSDIDVLDEEPELLSGLDAADLRQDMD
jgi:hypothetical protein